MRVTLVRHGQSQNNANRERQRQHDPELTKLGHEQARILGEWFATAQDIEEISDMDAHDPDRMTPARARITRIYVSPMRRALQTAKHLQDALNVPTLVWTDIHESGGLYVHTPEGVRGFPGLTREKMQHDFPKYTLPDTVTQHDGTIQAGVRRTCSGATPARHAWRLHCGRRPATPRTAASTSSWYRTASSSTRSFTRCSIICRQSIRIT